MNTHHFNIHKLCLSNVFDGVMERLKRLEVWEFQSFYIKKTEKNNVVTGDDVYV